LIDAAVLLIAAGEGDSFIEFGGGDFGVALLTQQTAFEDEDVGP